MLQISEIKRHINRIEAEVQENKLEENEALLQIKAKVKNIIKIKPLSDFWLPFLIASIWFTVGIIGIIAAQRR